MSIKLSDLNPEQEKAVKTLDGPVLVLAGAGSGKTRMLTYRIAYLINQLKIDPQHILAVTFTNKAATEMKERIRELIGDSAPSLWIGTFHSICARILRIEAEQLGYSRNFTIYDVDDQVRALKKIISALSIPQQLYSAKLIQNRLSRIKNQYMSYEEMLELNGDGLDEYIPDIYKAYQSFLKENNAFDFDDLLTKPIELFRQNPDIRKKYSDRLKYVLVDEYQDTNHAQYLLLKELVQDHNNICVVGDEDQAIYGWRGANIENILNFEKDYPSAVTFKLEENYRSNKNILDAANAVVKNNTERIGKNLWTHRDAGERVHIHLAADEVQEARKIVETIHEEMYTYKRKFNDIAILYRTNAQSRAIEDELRKNAIAYTVVGGVKFYDRKEIKDILAYLKLIINPADSVALKRVVNFPLRGIGETTISKMEKFAEMEHISLFDALGRVKEIAAISPAMAGRVLEFYDLIKNYMSLSSQLSAVELASTLATETGIIHHYKTEYDQYESESRVNNIRELFNSIEYFSEERQQEAQNNNLSAFLEEVSLMTDIDEWNAEENSVTLLTLHAAKGLEFPVVYIAGLEMGLLPLQRSSADMNELEEERRLLYVGMTRAQNRLYMSYASSRRRYNSQIQTTPSLFLDEIPADLIQYSSKQQAAPASAKTSRSRARKRKIQSYINAGEEDQSAGETFKEGQGVYHSTFGKGKIVNLEGSGEKMKITVDFYEEGITKKLIKQYANLSPLENS